MVFLYHLYVYTYFKSILAVIYVNKQVSETDCAVLDINSILSILYILFLNSLLAVSYLRD